MLIRNNISIKLYLAKNYVETLLVPHNVTLYRNGLIANVVN